MKDALGTVLLFTIAGFALALVFLLCARKATAFQKINLLVLASGFGLLGLLSVISYIIDSVKLFTLAICTGLLVILLVSPVITLIQWKKCTIPVKAKLTNKERHHYRNSTLWTPVFSYTYDGKNIISKSFLSYPTRTFGKLFEMSKNYEIYVNPDIPTDCADKRKFPSNLIAMILFGALILVFLLALVLLPSASFTIK